VQLYWKHITNNKGQIPLRYLSSSRAGLRAGLRPASRVMKFG